MSSPADRLTGNPASSPDVAILSPEQRHHVDSLARSLTAQQLLWVSGYLAGLSTGQSGGLEIAAPAGASASASKRTLTILYATETGNGRALAKDLAAAATARGLAPTIADVADYRVRQLKDEQDVLFVIATHGEGDPPAPALPFFEFVEGPRAPKLDKLTYSVLALGDSSYEHYCAAGRKLDARLAQLGATALHGRVDCDVDYDEDAKTWSDAVVDKLAETAGGGDGGQVIALRPAAAAGQSAHDKRNPFAATLLENIAIVGRHSTKETRHVELDLTDSGLSYQPGDALGFVPQNDPRVVEELLAACGLSADAEVAIKSDTLPLGQALASRLEITQGTPRFLEQWAALSDAQVLKDVAAGDAASRTQFLTDNHVADIIRLYPVPGVDPSALVAGLRPQQPRLYSIASSQEYVGEEVHLTIAPVRFDLHGSARGGVASTLIADRLQPGQQIPVYVQENPYFRLPDDDAPIVMVGPGTGIAPFRAFLQHREITGNDAKSWLFFGERTMRNDFLYQIELQKWLEDGVLDRLDVAFSRDGAAKDYVQHRMLERSAELYAWLQDGAHFYVCGDEKNMARDVHETLITIIERESGGNRDGAEAYVAELAADRRYKKDVY